MPSPVTSDPLGAYYGRSGQSRAAPNQVVQIVTHAIFPGLTPSLIGISLYRFDENVRSSLVLGFVGAGGIGFLILTAMNLFQYRQVATLLILTYVLVIVVERFSAAMRARIR
jgi:phosphonate transport system permease protein